MPLAPVWGMTSSRTPFEAPPAVAVQRSDDDGGAVVSVPASGVDLEGVEQALIAFALQTTGGNRTHAARLLRLTRSALLYRMHKYGLNGQEGVS